MSDLNLDELSFEVGKLKNENLEQGIKIRDLEEKIIFMKYGEPAIRNQRVVPKPFEVKEVLANLQPEVKLTKSFWQRDSSEWEELFGGTILNRLGIIALLLALIYFFKYAFDNNWVGDTGKVALGIIFGLALLGAGEHFRKKGLYKFAYGFTGGGIASLYASIYAGYNFYHLLEIYPAFGAMIVITLSAVALSLHHDSPAIASLGVLGGFLTPFLLSTPNPNAVGLFGYLTFINLIVLGISLYRRWRHVNILGFVLTSLVSIFWLSADYQVKDLYITTAFTIASFSIYLGVTIFFTLLSQSLDEKYDVFLLIANPAIHFSVLYYLLEESLKNNTGFLAAFMCVIYLLVGWGALSKKKDERILMQLFLGVSAFFLTLAIPLQFSGFSVTIFWVLEALFIWYAGLLIDDIKIRNLSALVMLLALFHLGAFDTNVLLWDLKSYWPFVNERTLVYVVTAGALFAGYYIYKRKSALLDYTDESIKLEKKFAKLLPAFAILLLFSLATMEISSFCEFKVIQINKQVDTINRSNSSAGVTDQQRTALQVKPLQNLSENWNGAGKLSVSGLWLLSALGLLSFGLNRIQKPWRMAGLFLVGITGIKIILYDLADVILSYMWLENTNTYWPLLNKRALSLIFLIGIVYVVKFLYKKFLAEEKQQLDVEEVNIIKLFPALNIFLLGFMLTLEIDSLCRFNDFQQNYTNSGITLWGNIRMISISVLWTLFSLGFIFYGLKKKEKFWRLTGITLFVIVIMKLFFIDLAQLELLYRVIIFACLGGIMILASYLYQGQQRGEE